MTAMGYEDLAVSPTRTLEDLFQSAAAPALESMPGYEWRGFNLSAATRLLGIQKFIKGFYRQDNRYGGYNIQVRQNGLSQPWIHRPSAEAPKRYAFFVVTPVDPASSDALYPRALLLNYGASQRNPRLGIERLIRDYLVQPHPDQPDLLLGKAYFAFGKRRAFSNFFILERLRPTGWLPGAPL